MATPLQFPFNNINQSPDSTPIYQQPSYIKPPLTNGVGQNPLLSPSGTNSGVIRLSSSKPGESGGDTVWFRVTPELEESGSTSYIPVDDIRAPSTFLIYIGSPSRTFSLNTKLVSRTVAEADENFKFKSILQAWRMPVKAISGSKDSTPETLRLYGYGRNFQGITCVMVNLNLSYPINVDYIQTSNGSNMPIVMPISISLRESHSIDDMKGFDYSDYKSGKLPSWT